MKRKVCIQQPMMGQRHNWIEYETTVPSNVTLVFFMGSGEIYGPADGSRLALVEKYGPGKHALNGFEFPFNIFLPQGIKLIGEFKNTLLPFLKSRNQKVILMGHSRGGREVQHYFGGFEGRDTLGIVKCFVSIAGQYTAADGFTYCGCVDENSLFVHSEADKDVPIIYDTKLHTALLSCEGRQSKSKFIRLKNENHAQTVEYATIPDMNSEVFKFILESVADVPAPPQDLPVDGLTIQGTDLIVKSGDKKFKLGGLTEIE